MITSTTINGPTNGPTNGAYGVGLGNLGAPADFRKGVEFNCTTTICYGIGTTHHALIIQLQQMINKFSAKAGFTKIAEDGKIGTSTGNSTVSAMQKAATYIRTKVAMTPVGISAWVRDALLAQVALSPTKELLAAKAPSLVEILSLAAVGKGPIITVAAPPPILPPTGGGTTTAPPIAPPQVQSKPPPMTVPSPVTAQPPTAAPPASTEPGAEMTFPPEQVAPVTPAATTAPADTGMSKKTWWIIGGVTAGVLLVGVVGVAMYRSGRKKQAVPAPAVSGPRRLRRRAT